MDFSKELATQFSCDEKYVSNIITLLDEGNTIPFIARYRKELHGSMDDQKIREIAEQLEYLRTLEARREEVRELIAAQEKLTDEINEALNKAKTLAEINDIYLPFRPKRKTKASVARARGLEPLADLIYAQTEITDPLEMAEAYINPELEVETREAALEGALHIIAENISDNAEIRKVLRALLWSDGEIVTKAADAEAETVYTMYYDYREPLKTVPTHRILAINRGEKEDALKVSVELDKEKALSKILSMIILNNSLSAKAVEEAAEDAYTRLIFSSVSTEIRRDLSDKACEESMKVFKVNLKQLLMQPPIKGYVTIGLDPGYRTGCKVAVVDSTGRVLDTGVIYPTHSQTKIDEAKVFIKKLIKKHDVKAIAIGNGTASRETEAFAAEVLKELPECRAAYVIVDEAGASVYSASKLAADEFPEFDLTLRSAVSIARRLQDPLAELVKIDPKALGVGQYQHDMPQKRLSETLDGVVEDCVNSVGADLNTASPALLSRVAGLTSAVCKNIVKYREENGAFKSRKELLKVPKLGAKAFEQCAGFLRVAESDNPLDNTAVHPESYEAAESIITRCGFTLEQLKKGGLSTVKEAAVDIGVGNLARELGMGLPTVADILSELAKPGRDPRDDLPKPILKTDVLDIKDLKEGMVLSGTVRNVVDFGVFIDIGVHQSGLAHISQLCEKYIRHPSEVLKIGDIVQTKVISVDVAKGKIGLTLKGIK